MLLVTKSRVGADDRNEKPLTTEQIETLGAPIMGSRRCGRLKTPGTFTAGRQSYRRPAYAEILTQLDVITVKLFFQILNVGPEKSAVNEGGLVKLCLPPLRPVC